MASSGTDVIRILGKASPVTVLGPGRRAVVWVQGCHFECPGCSATESWDLEGGTETTIPNLAEWTFQQEELEGVTFSGGEPMLQAAALVDLTDRILASRDFGIICYTGYRLEELLELRSNDITQFLSRIDLLIDGRYELALHQPLLWRASSNQRLVPLSSRYDRIVEDVMSGRDVPAGLEFFVSEGNLLHYAGVPEKPGFHSELAKRLSQAGIELSPITEEKL